MTLAELRTMARQLSDMENSQFVSDAELTSYINLFYKDTYDELISFNEDFNIQTYQFTLSSSNTQSLPADFYKARILEKHIDTTGNSRVRIPYLNLEEKNSQSGLRFRLLGNTIQLYPDDASQWNGAYTLWYYPTLTQLVNPGDNTIPLEGMESLVAIRAANLMLAKQELTNNGLLKVEIEMRDRLKRLASYRSSEGVYIAKVR